MRRLYFFMTFIFFSNIILGQSELPNGNFESWNGTYSPEYWSGINENLGFLGTVITYEQSSDSHTGNYAAKLITKNATLLNVPGLLTYGTLDIDLTNQNFSLDGGVPITGYPSKLTGWYKYNPKNNDTMGIILGLSRYDANIKKRDTLAVACFYSNASNTDEYNQFEAYILYMLPEPQMPDSLNIIAISSGFNPQAGSTLLIDDFMLIYDDALILPTTCHEPQNITANSFIASWNAVNNAIGYTLTIASDFEFEHILEGYNNLDVGNITEMEVNRLNENTLYYYFVQVKYPNVSSFISNIVSTQTTSLQPLSNNLQNLQIVIDEGTISITPKSMSTYHIRLIDMHGKIIHSTQTHDGETLLFNQTKLSGIYIIEIVDESYRYVRKIWVE